MQKTGSNNLLFNLIRGLCSLNCSAIKGEYGMCKIFLEQGKANVDEVSQKLCTPLLYCARGGYDTLIDLLLTNKANPQHQDASGATALHHACEKDFPIVVTKLIKGGADSSVQDFTGKTPLITAVIFKGKQALNSLLENNADTNAIDYLGHTALFYAARDGNEEMVKLLIEKGNADLNLYSMPNQNMEKEMMGKKEQSKSDKLLNLALNTSRVPLHAATVNGHTEILNYLISKNVRIMEPGRHNNNALHIAAFVGQLKAAKILIQAGIDPSEKNANGQSAIDIFAKYHSPCVAELIEFNKSRPEQAPKLIEGENEQENLELSMYLDNSPENDEDSRISKLAIVYGPKLGGGIIKI